MQKSENNEEKNKNWAKPAVAIQACPRCGSGKTRCSPAKISDKLFNIWFYKSYRCQACRYRFWVMRPLLLIIIAGIVLLLILVAEGIWIKAVVQQPDIATPVETVSQDEIKSLAEKGDAEAELKMGLHYASIAWEMKGETMETEGSKKTAPHDQGETPYRYGLALKTATEWLEKAARQGHPLAQSTLGEIYQSGTAIDSDIERAYLWFNLAAAQGMENAASSRDKMAKLLTPTQVASMQEEARRIAGATPNKPAGG